MTNVGRSVGRLKRPRLQDLSWMRSAACIDQEGFYPVENEGAYSRTARVMKARSLCFACDVRASCLEYATKNKEALGIWGGQTVEERKANG